MSSPLAVRSLDFGDHFEDFLVSAVASVLAIRLFLHLAGYPTVGGESLHVAHMLWGGLFMAVALLLLLGWLGRSVKALAAVLGGIGFGTFIDELGKFLTHDNDYFFEPTVALIYVVFVLMWIAVRTVRRRPLTRREALANAVELALEAARGDLQREERRRARELLRRAGPDAGPLARALEAALADTAPDAPARPHLLDRWKERLHGLYLWLVDRAWFAPAVVGFFALHAVANLAKTVVTIRGAWELAAVLGLALLAVPALVARSGIAGTEPDRRRRAAVWGLVLGAALLGGFAVRGELPALGPYGWAELVFSVVPALLVVAGILRMPADRLAAYRWFKQAVLVLLLVTQFFAFYRDQFSAVYGLFSNLIVLVTLNYMIAEERGRVRPEAAGETRRGSPSG